MDETLEGVPLVLLVGKLDGMAFVVLVVVGFVC